MVLKIEPIFKAVEKICTVINDRHIFGSLGRHENKFSGGLAAKYKNGKKKTKIIFLSPRGKKFTQKTAQNWAKNLKQLIIISGRYEGIDERVKKLASETISVGDFITLGGEIPAMAVIEAVARLIPDVVGKKTSIEKSDFPQYTRPEVFSPKKGIKWPVPKILVSGNHKKIEEWRKKHSKEIE